MSYITLFAPETYYIQNKCGDPVELAKQCVTARVDFFQSRNPYLVRYKTALSKGIAYGTMDCPFKQYCRRTICDNSCPPLVEFSYLLERNKMSCNSSVFEIQPKMLSDISEWLTVAPNSYSVSYITRHHRHSFSLNLRSDMQFMEGELFEMCSLSLEFQ